ncbi:uncharacterized protein LOC123320305 [Coccinella septempunctata]|uniref:uncharacterized protein LOC123320305 n=1 Tax=Coccinella septempunctata TaxID=41139 RepID=UPI001D093BE0|nr:uncharacterized protein LOC123320305 [Coccinella septempunctata]
MKTIVLAVGILFLIEGVRCFIIPDEIPSLLSVIYSNIPIIKKGTDSRVGWGFRLGDRADFQFLVELGPQKYTQALANEPDKTVSNKRNTLNDLASQLWAQRQEDKRKQQQKETQGSKGGDESSWLQNWSSATKDQLNEGARPGLAIGEIDAKSVIPPDDDRDDGSRSLKNPENDEKSTNDSENDVK